MHFLSLAVVFLALIALQEPALKLAEFDYSKVDRKIASQPKYVGEPKYALLLPGDGRTRIWMVLDKSAPAAPHHDVLYFDVDGDGNLGEEGERFEGRQGEHALVMNVGKVAFPESKIQLEDLHISTYTQRTPLITTISFRMNGKVTVYGAYGPDRTTFSSQGRPRKRRFFTPIPGARWRSIMHGPRR